MATSHEIKHLVEKLNAATVRIKQRLTERYLAQIPTQPKTKRGSDPKSIWWGYFPVVLVAILGLTITIMLFVQSMRWEKNQVEIAFREASQDRILVIQREIKHSLRIVLDIASFFEASEIVGRREFRKFVGPALKNQAGIKTLEWVPVVTDEMRQTFIEEGRQSFPPFEILEMDDSGMLNKSPRRLFYYPILYIQPYQYNKQLLGLNMGIDPTASNLFSEAEITREIQVSPGIYLNDDGERKTGIMVAAPVFFNADNTNEESPQANATIRGFAIGVFYIGEIIERALESLLPGGIDIHFYQSDEDEEGRLLYSHHTRLRDSSTVTDSDINQEISYAQEINVGTQQWKIVCNSASDKFTADTWSSWLIFFGSLAFTLLFTIYIATLVGRARQVRLEVEERTAQLWEVVQALNQEVIERKSAEQELQRLNETLEHHIANRTAEAERRAQYLEQFAYVTSHDLKAPLRAVSNLAQWIEEDLHDKLDDAAKEQLALLRDRVKRMHDLIEGLLEYSRVGRSSDPESLVDTQELVEEIIDSLSTSDRFSIKIKGKMPTLNTDRLQLVQVLSNLISNSLMHHGGKKGKIRIKCDELDQFYQFSVCDDGQGIAPQYHKKIFLMFQTLESSDLESSTGIGLALVKKIVEEHGGTIKLRSEPGEGACFYFTWPKVSPSE
ncbi:MAG: CHASE domain-containing protein [Candidatus Thiodiazotropha endolucinida]|nr:CHASE domain-containing protein [Candidatus Thiodiazotropha taylori]MCG8094771.1 CHASE domain-containing protein [Candidatus Thiodiazotropha endolucinida]MCG8061914.1 CHASE domain-containing protein [Candidatus Thiodiazotropha taylori]MCG8063448.1 CHASE domain-containing protein [Candidatus Thiodiazotropha taylori]MCW4329532.1 CHASE domain-containing protein [Candidatus Thiodiazotropha endolucinida]